jgi:hypothetical protein
VFLPDDSIYFDNWRRVQHLDDQIEQAKIHQTKMLDGSIYKCEDSTHEATDFWQFLPVYVGELHAQNTELKYSGQCFTDATISLAFSQSAENGKTNLKVKIDVHSKKSLFCQENLFLTTGDVHHIENLFLPRLHTIEFLNLRQDELDDIRVNGFLVYMFCHGVSDSFVSLFNTIKLFLGGLGSDPRWPIIGSHVPAYMEKANLKFLEHAMNWKMEPRKTQKVWLTEDQIHDGDFITIVRLDGLDEIIMWGTGSHSGHSVVVLTLDGEKYVVESQDGWYWPRQDIQRTPWKKWMEYAENADFNAAILPLKDEYREKFNQPAAEAWFKWMEGYPYGYHNFVYSWIDTPEHNWPSLMPIKLIPVLLDIIERIMPAAVNSIFTEGLNMRLGTRGLNIREITMEASSRNMTLEDVMAIPERDTWIYSDGPSQMCSALVAGVYKAAGLFDDLKIEATEFTPKDVYQLAIFNTTAVRPEQCVLADPDLPYCQILGKYRLTLPGLSTIPIYEHMNNHCPSQDPDYFRPEGC